MTLSERIEKVKSKLALLKTKDKNMSIFGSGDDKFFGTIGHHYELNPVLTEDQIVALEKKLLIKFPEEYREFLKQVGDGGAGPSWGLFNVKSATPGDDFLKEYPEFCSMECSYADEYANGIKQHHFDKGERDYMEPVEPFGGYMKLSDYGHGMTAYMVVGGDQQIGKMWFLNEEGEAGPRIAPMIQKIEGRDWQVSFLDWYENWLDESLTPGVMIDDPKTPFEKPEEVVAVNYGLSQLESVPDHVFECVNLKRLDLQFNKLTSIPEKIQNLKKLETLILAGNKIPKEEQDKIKNLLPKTEIIY